MSASPSSAHASDHETCPICLNPIPDQVNGRQVSRALCCGKQFCRQCVDDGHLHRFLQQIAVTDGDNVAYTAPQQVDTCPLCRTPLPRTPQEGLDMVMKHVHDGKAWAQFNLANRYENGRAVPQSWDKAREWHLKAAAQGFAASEHALGLIYSNNNATIPKNIPVAVEWLEKATAKGHAGAQYSLAHLYLNMPGKQRQAKALFDASAAQKYDVAECEVGYFYENGVGGYPRNIAKAKEFYQRAALQGNDTAQFNLGGILFNMERNLPAALFWLRALCDSPKKSEHKGDATALKTQLEGGLRATCAGCYTRGPLLTLRCAGCQAYYYCKKDCQVRHWKAEHKMEFKAVQQLKKEMEDVKKQELVSMLTGV